MIRDFARHVTKVFATSEEKPIAIHKITKDTWEIKDIESPVTLTYEVYAWDLSVRESHLDETHGFFNGSSVFLRVHGFENTPHIVDIQRPKGEDYAKWMIATTLPEKEASRYNFGTYIAKDYLELIDHPVEMGTFLIADFTALGISHEIVITGKVPNVDLDRLANDLTKICETQIAFFEPETKKAPMSRYLFMVYATGNGYGGLEHRSSCALICSRNDLPTKGKDDETPKITEEYQNFLGLCSHEYFHTWHVKRIRPLSMAQLDLQKETYTSLLWLFEGFTSYYDDLMLVRSGLIDVNAYLRCLTRTINNVRRAFGRKKQTVAESSFDAWIKFYKQNENSTNTQISYYAKGSLVALALDLTIRIRTNNEKSLDDAMRLLWQRFGHNFEQSAKERGLLEREAEKIIEEAAGVDLKSFFNRYVYGTDELQLASFFENFGIIEKNEPTGKSSLNIRVQKQDKDYKIANVFEGGAAYLAGLSAGDTLVAIDGIRVMPDVSTNTLEKILSRYQIGEVVQVHVFRRDELKVFSIELFADDTPKYSLTVNAKQTPAETNARQLWLKERQI